MKIQWLGHACFKLVSSKGVRVITDPFDETVGYDMPAEEADIVTISHRHFDHAYVQGVKGQPKLIDKAGSFHVDGISVKGIKSYHDDDNGKKRGDNIIYCFKIDDLNVCHLGDLGHVLNEEQAQEIGPVDVLLIPVGGTYTIDAQKAAVIAMLLRPKMVIPMHFKTPKINFPISGVDGFLEKMHGGTKLDQNMIEVKKEDLTEELKVVVLNYE